MAEEKNQKNLLKKKIELKAVCEWVGEGSRVLDLGCGRGILLYELVRRRNIYAVGVDSDFEKISRDSRYTRTHIDGGFTKRHYQSPYT